MGETATTITISARFDGPPTTGNGGYVCGLVARHVDGPAEVTLWAPPPLERPLTLERAEPTETGRPWGCGTATPSSPRP